MTPYNAPAGSVWEMDAPTICCGTIFVVLDGYVEHGEGTIVYRRAVSLTSGGLLPFGQGSWMDNDAVRIA